MFKKTMLVLVFWTIAILMFADTNHWQGDLSNSWNTAGNWSLNHIPTSSEPVHVPSSSVYDNYPYMSATVGYNAYCSSIVIDAGGQLRVGYATLTVSTDMTIYGYLYFSSPSAVVDVNDDIIWGTGNR